MCRSKRLRILFLLGLLISACSRSPVDEAPEIIVEMETIPSPAKTGDALLMIQLTDPQGQAIGDFTIDVRGDMSHAGMAPVIVTQAKAEQGMYTVPFEWTMAGDWFIAIKAQLPDGRTLMRTLPIHVKP